MYYTDRETVKQFLKENDIRDLAQLNGFIKEMTGVMIEEMLEAERDAHLGYTRCDSANKETQNSRNGYSKKTVRSVFGPGNVFSIRELPVINQLLREAFQLYVEGFTRDDYDYATETWSIHGYNFVLQVIGCGGVREVELAIAMPQD